MARKNLLTGLTEKKLPAGNAEETPPPAKTPPLAFSGRGAFGAVARTIDALAVRADAARDLEAKLAAGEVVVELDPGLIDRSFITDRMAPDDENYRQLRAGIEAEGQASPILVRPHPTTPGRYQVAFGHRRLKAALELKRKVRCIVKPLDDRALVIAQGQENSARADLSFIERGRFAQALEEAGYDRATIMTALSADKTALSRMIAVVNAIPPAIVAAIGPAPAVGRDRWTELVQIFAGGAALPVETVSQSPDFEAADTNERFAIMLQALTEHVARHQAAPKPKRDAPVGKGMTFDWGPKGGETVARVHREAKTFTLTIDKTVAPDFGEFLLKRLERLYADYKAGAAKADAPAYHPMTR